ncbi:MAG: hypothetical protein Kow002_19830 [Anaerolineales bacterium]
MVNMMLDVTRIDEELVEATFVPVPFRQVVESVAEGLKKPATERGIEIVLKLADDTPKIFANPGMIQKALYHLIVNAIKYTPDGGAVTVCTRAVTLANDLPGVEVSVQDTGIGIDPEHHELIFEKFYQVGSVALHSSGKTSFKGGGPGLGLALVKGVAQAHGGETWVESAGHDETNYPGSRFFLQIPLNVPSGKR